MVQIQTILQSVFVWPTVSNYVAFGTDVLNATNIIMEQLIGMELQLIEMELQLLDMELQLIGMELQLIDIELQMTGMKLQLQWKFSKRKQDYESMGLWEREKVGTGWVDRTFKHRVVPFRTFPRSCVDRSDR